MTPSLLDRYLALYPPAERHDRHEEIRTVITGKNDPFLIPAIHSAEARKAALDAIAHQPQLPRRSFLVLSAVTGMAIGVVAALVASSITHEVTMRQLRPQVAALGVAADKSTAALAQMHAASASNYELADEFRKMLVMATLMARAFNGTPEAAIGRRGDDLVLMVPKEMLSIDGSNPKYDSLLVKRDLIGTGIANDLFEREIEKADATIKQAGENPP